MIPAESAPAGFLASLLRGAAALLQRDHQQLAALATACRRSVAIAADDWVQRSVAAKGWAGMPHAAAEEWASGPLPVARLLAVLEHQLGDDAPPQPFTAFATMQFVPMQVATMRADTVARAVHAPRRLADRWLLRGHHVLVHTANHAAVATRPPHGDVALVLGAGNVTATPLLDVLDQVFLRGRAVLLKLSPLHDALLPTFAAALWPLVDADLLRLVTGDAQVAQSMLHHDAIRAVHLTGSSTTWTTLATDPRLSGKELTAEVGCCTPALVLPADWSERELQHVATQLAAYVATNGGATCVAPRVLLTAKRWPQRRRLQQLLHAAMAQLPSRVPFHPSVREHFAVATGRTPDAPALAPTFCGDRDGAADRDLCRRELFAPVLRELPLDGDDVATFVRHAAAFVHEHCFGSLSAYVFAPPRFVRRERRALDAAIDALPHGTIAVNTWTGLGYGLATTPWGVPAGRPTAHGSGWTRNNTGLADVRRVVVEAPLRPRPLPPWLPAHRHGAATLRALTHFYLSPSLPRLATIVLHACRP